MNILFVGNLNSYTRSYQRCQAIRDLGHNGDSLSTIVVPWKPRISNSSLFFRALSKYGFPADRTRVNRNIILSIKNHCPDLLWIEKGLSIRRSTLTWVRRNYPNVIRVFQSEDDMYARHNQSVYFRRCLPLYDIVFTTKSHNVKELPEIGARRVVFVDMAYDQNTHRPLSVSAEDDKRLGGEVIFVGSFEGDRAEHILYLAQNGFPVRVWGSGWESWVGKHPNMIVEGKPIYGEDYVKALCASKIALGFLRKINRDLQTSRTMEIPACGTFMLSERTHEHLRLFEEGEEAEFFDSKEELLKKVAHFIQHDSERETIAKGGRERCLESGYSHHDRLRLMFKKLEILESS